MRILIYDLEIAQCIPERNQPNDPNYEYCQGWRDFAGMGISCVGWAILGQTEASLALWQNPDERFEFIQQTGLSDRIVGFNSKSFDDLLLQETGLYIESDWDLLEEVRLAAYGSTSWEDCPRGYTYRLDALAIANGLGGKSGSGEAAPKLFQDGLFEELLSYCGRDVSLTAKLIELGLNGKLRDPNTGDLLQLRPID